MTVSPNPSFTGQSVTITATVAGGGALTEGDETIFSDSLSVNLVPTGTVTFIDTTNHTTLGTAPLVTVGVVQQATFSTAALGVGNINIQAVYGGDANFTGSSSNQVAQTVNPGPNLQSLSSGGVFNANNQLVRTIWSAQTNDPRTASPAAAAASWDGLLDDGTVAPAGTYSIGVVSSNCTYTWEGVVGNSCPNHYQPANYPNVWRYLQGTTPIWGMACTDALDVYYVNSYHEKVDTTFFTTTSDMQHGTVPGLFVSPANGTQYPFAIPNLTWGGNFCENCVTDGTNIYVTVNQGTTDPTFVVVGSTHLKLVLSGSDVNGNIGAYGSSSPNAFVTSTAAQHTGGASGFFFIARPVNSELWVIRQTTGTTVATNVGTYPNAQWLACDPSTANGNLWIAYQPSGHSFQDTVEKFTVNAGTGALTTTGVKVTLPNTPTGQMAISPDGSTLLVMDSVTNQVRAYNTSDGSVKTAWGNSGTLGDSGGYATSPTVTDTKYMFFAIAAGLGGSNGGYICYFPDGSWWLGDQGNYRNFHYSAGNSPTIIERTYYVPTVYSCQVMRGDPTRVFGNFLEWKINYSLPLAPGNGSFTLANNWAFNIDSNHIGNAFQFMRTPGLYNGSRAYCFVRNSSTGFDECWELASTGLRYTGIAMSSNNNPDRNMNLYTIDSNFGSPGGGSLYKNPLLHFDGSGNPVYAGDPTQTGSFNGSPPSGWQTILTSQSTPSQYPDFETFEAPSDLMPNGHYVMQKNRSNPGTGSNPVWTNTYHHSSIDGVSGVWKSGTHPEAPPLQGGQGAIMMYFPNPPFTITGGNQAPTNNFQGSFLTGADFSAGAIDYFNCVRGEVWSGGQTNRWIHWHQSGLPIGNFGMAIAQAGENAQFAPEYSSNGLVQGPQHNDFWLGVPGHAGNVASGGIAYVASNNAAYIYHGEEWVHSGLHRWLISNYNSITFFSNFATVKWSGSYTAPPTTGSDMLLGLPYYSVNVPNGSAGWTRNPTSNVGTWPGSDPLNGNGTLDWNVCTNFVIPDRHLTPDLYWRAFQPSSVAGVTPASMTKAIPRTKTGNWKLSIQTALRMVNASWDAVANTFNGIWFDVVDGTNKRIVSVFTGSYSNSHRGYNNAASFWVNEQPVVNPATYSNDWTAITCGGTSEFAPPVWDMSHYNFIPVLTLSVNTVTQQVAATYATPAGVVIGSVATSVPYDAGADIVHPSQFQINMKFDNSATNIDACFEMTRLLFTES